MRHKRSSAERTRLLIVIDPTVHAPPVENVLAVRHTPDFFFRGEFAQAHGAARRRRIPVGGCQVAERRHGEKLADEEGGESRLAWRRRRREVRGGGIGVEEVGDAEEAEEGEDEGAQPREEGKRVEEHFRNQQLRVPYGKTHRRARETIRALFFKKNKIKMDEF